MSDSWLRFPIYVNGEKRFDANPNGSLATADAYERMDCVFDNIECCFAEGHLMDLDTFDRLEVLRDRIRDNDIPSFDQIADLVDSVGSRCGFGINAHSGSAWIRGDDSGQMMISIDRDKIVAESNRRLFG